MKLANLQAFIAEQIMAVTALAAFAPFTIYSFTIDDTEAQEAIGAGLRAKGVFIEIGLPELQPVDSTIQGASLLMANFDVFVAEDVKTAHTPAGLALVDAVIAAVTAKAKPGQPVRVASYEAAKSEQGYILHIINFEHRVLIA